jgi:hypothetical protein
MHSTWGTIDGEEEVSSLWNPSVSIKDEISLKMSFNAWRCVSKKPCWYDTHHC